MGFFTKSTPTPHLLPLSKERIKQALEAKGWSYRVDGDGDISGGWEDGFFWFLLQGSDGEILLVRGTWYPKLPLADFERIAAVCLEWNRERLWPKAYPRISDEAEVVVHTEHTVDYEHGLTDEQLQLHLLTAVATSSQFFEHLNTEFPEAYAASRE